VKDFWVSSGHHLLDRDPQGGLAVTDTYLKAYFARPELMPPDDACPVERGLHAALLADPRRAVAAGEVALIKDGDARENWSVVLAFRDRLLKHPTLQAAWLDFARNGVGSTPPLFLSQLVHVILRSALDGEEDAFVLRAGELFFRTQKASLHEGRLLLADEEVVAGHEETRAASPLMAMLGGPAVSSLDLLTTENAGGYHARSDAFDMVLDFRPSGEGRKALANVMERWIAHLLALDVAIEPLPLKVEEAFHWFVGLDAEGTRVGNALWQGEAIEGMDQDRVLAIFRLTVKDRERAIERMRGKPVHLILATTDERLVRLKPQNLIAGLPLAERRAS
jgi:hypothetical protein